MFETLKGKLQTVFDGLAKRGALSEADVDAALARHAVGRAARAHPLRGRGGEGQGRAGPRVQDDAQRLEQLRALALVAQHHGSEPPYV